MLRPIGTAVAVTTAGCTGDVFTGAAELQPAILRMETIDDPELPTKVLYTIGIEHRGQRAELMDDILAGGAVVKRTNAPLPANRHIYYDDAVYQLSHKLVERTPATSYHVRMDTVQKTEIDSEAIRYSKLPAIDQEKFAARGWDDGVTFGLRTSLLYISTERNKSALVPESKYTYIVWEEGSEAAWFVNDSYDTTINTYEYVAEQYSTASEYGHRMRDRMMFELSDLSAAEADIVQRAIDEDRYAVDREHIALPAFRSLADRFRGQDQAHSLIEDGEGDLSGPYLVQYGNSMYWTVLDIQTDIMATESPA